MRCRQQRGREEVVVGSCGEGGGVVRAELDKEEEVEAEEGRTSLREGGLRVSSGAKGGTFGDQVVQLAVNTAGSASAWAGGFVPRSPSEPSRNCACIDRNLQEQMVETLTTALLETENWVEVRKPTSAAGSGGSSRSQDGLACGGGGEGGERRGEGCDEVSRQEAGCSPQETLWNRGGRGIW